MFRRVMVATPRVNRWTKTGSKTSMDPVFQKLILRMMTVWTSNPALTIHLIANGWMIRLASELRPKAVRPFGINNTMASELKSIARFVLCFMDRSIVWISLESIADCPTFKYGDISLYWEHGQIQLVFVENYGHLKIPCITGWVSQTACMSGFPKMRDF